LNIQRKFIRSACGHGAYARGLNYFENDHVRTLEVSNFEGVLRLSATTSGSGRNVYQQDIFLDSFDKEIDIEGECSCPVGFNCKHVAAVCLQYEDDNRSSGKRGVGGSKSRTASEHETDNWLKRLSESASDYRDDDDHHQDWLVFILGMGASQFSGLAGQEVSVNARATHQRKNVTGLVKGREVALYSLNQPYASDRQQIQSIDREIAALLANTSSGYYWDREQNLRGRSGGMAVWLMLDTGRCYWEHSDNPPLGRGSAMQLELSWQGNANGEVELKHNLPDHFILLKTHPILYLDTEQMQIGELDTADWNLQQLLELSRAPRLSTDQAERLSAALLKNHPALALPIPSQISIQEIDGEHRTPCLSLISIVDGEGKREHCLLLDFDYDGYRLDGLPSATQTLIERNKEWTRVRRNSEFEQSAIDTLKQHGFYADAALGNTPQPIRLKPQQASRLGDSIDCWAGFIDTGVDQLRELGWRIEIDASFELRFESGDWQAEIEEIENSNDWFSLRFDLTIENETLPLAPLLIPLLGSDLDELPEVILLPIGDHRYLRLPSERIRPFLNTLAELYGLAKPDAEGVLKISRFDAISVDRLAEHGVAMKGAKRLRELARQLKDFDGIKAVAPPPELHAELRPYQQSGLNWLQFLREYQFGGILADDMGLGKTVQTLAHLLVEKQAGRLKQPALVVAPTSLMGNWAREAERFTPQLRVVVLQGTQRHQKFDRIETSDLVLTTYPLLVRDQETLLSRSFHSVILDEAQAIKNPKTRMAEMVRKLDCQHRLCLTGTPLENHLGELWAIFDFLMPGFLGANRDFTSLYRTPIEKQGNVERQQSLAQRVQPFLLRREKDQVASELPPKTEIQQTVRLEGKQAELYESIRVAMDKRVREAINSKGLGGSHITILDALLKLRQVCCDPRLLKLEQARHTSQSAKLELLMDLLPEQLEEGRRIILFSQFTSMLALIEAELKQRGIAYTKLTGQTRHRDAAIQRFREGEVNLFLISLKAGGTGLNLTEADTVILYDPWWNPAVEAQAIDRAHRIGQDKPVFIYRLTVSGSVEEKMLAMQERKRALAKGIYSAKSGEDTPLLNAESLQNLFAPIDE
jgi:superfamily II DNA or RNA helicase